MYSRLLGVHSYPVQYLTRSNMRYASGLCIDSINTVNPLGSLALYQTEQNDNKTSVLEVYSCLF